MAVLLAVITHILFLGSRSSVPVAVHPFPASIAGLLHHQSAALEFLPIASVDRCHYRITLRRISLFSEFHKSERSLHVHVSHLPVFLKEVAQVIRVSLLREARHENLRVLAATVAVPTVPTVTVITLTVPTVPVFTLRSTTTPRNTS